MFATMRWLILFPALLAASDVGRNWGVERQCHADPVTGVRVCEITAPGSSGDNLYFHVSNFTADNQSVLFVSNRTGTWQLFRADVASGRITQLTDDRGIEPRTACPDPRNADLVYLMRGPEVLVLNIRTFATRRIGAIPPPHTGGFLQPTVSHDGRSLAVAKQRDARNWEIGLMDIETGRYRTVVTQGFRITHVQHSPTDPVIFYAWETGGYAPQRSWLVDDDGSANRPLYAVTDPKQWVTPLKEWMTHEAWVAGTGQMTMVHDKVGIVLVNKDGSWRVVREGNYWHAAARPDGKFIAIDDAAGRVWVAETATGNIRLLATGIRDKVRVHGHVSFDRQGRYVQFHTGRSHETIAVVDLNELPPESWTR